MIKSKKGLTCNILLLLSYLIVARFSCIALSNISLMSMKFIFIYGSSFLLIFFIENHKVTKNEFICLITLLFYVLYVVLKTTIITGNLFNTDAFNAYVLFFLFSIYMFLKYTEEKNKRKIFGIALCGFLFTYLYSISRLSIDPTLSRKAAASISSQQGIDGLNAIGGFDTVYGSILFIVILLFLSEDLHKSRLKLICVLSLITAVIFIVMASYGTALVLLVCVISLWLMQKNKIFGIIILCIIIFVVVNHIYIGDVLINMSSRIQFSDILSQKISEIGTMLQTGEAAGTLAGEEGRLSRMGWSISAFLKYPIFGGYGKSDVLIGYHSEIVDSLGKFGIIGFGFLGTFFAYFFKDIYHNVSTRKGKRCCFFAILMYIVIAVLNPALYTQQVLPLFILLPVYDDITSYKKITVIKRSQ